MLPDRRKEGECQLHCCLLSRFLQHIAHEKRYSAHTLRAYRSDLQQMLGYLCVADDAQLRSVGHRQLRGWFSNLIEQGLCPRSVKRKISSASTFYSYLVKEKKDLFPQNPIEKVVSPKGGKRLPFFYKEEQLATLLDDSTPDPDGGYEPWRNHAMMELLYGTGMRRAELVGLRCGDVSADNQTVRVLGKGSKERIIPLSPHLCEVLAGYLEARGSYFDSSPHSPLFCTKSGKAVYGELVYRVVRASLTAQGVGGKKSPHVMRHSFATHMLNNGADLKSIQDLLGHSNLSATQVYTHNNIDALLSSYRQAHPHAEGKAQT
ncbi:MAG: tyrosine-type recombinase/integrase [Prevotellaceae bacterium]|jgi:integrase/recombinase XerC|nr:tyrosine-type recombinase/integrase [Prevotellaceae bacterium]